jgi:alanyl-tRNA synthetase
MRRGMRHAHILGAKEPLMYRLVPTLVGLMGEAYPELKRAEALITETLRLEEERFRRTLEQGLKLLDAETAKLSSGQKLPGEAAFRLYDTFGFPVDLTQDALKARGIEVDMAGFERNMERQREEARKSWTGSGDAATEKLWFELGAKLPATEFLGYEKESAEGEVLALVKDGRPVDRIKAGDTASVIVNQSPFYAESGGQVGDSGSFATAAGAAFTVTDVQKKLGRLWVHEGTVMKGEIAVGDSVEMRIDIARRNAIRANHSATHLMHEALRRVLGEHVSQKGSRQDAERTRFDVSHPYAMTNAQLREVEALVNEEIRANSEVSTRLMAIEDAMNSGAMALFGEKYDDEVRVVSMGSVAPGANKAFSVELCGGTHTKRTGDIGLFKIVSEGGLSAGVRRLEALTGENALRYFEEQDERLRAAAAALKTTPGEVASRVEALVSEKRKLEQQVSELRRQLAAGGGAGDASAQVKDVGGVKFTARVLEDFPAKDLKPMADDLKAKLGSGVVALIATNEGKASIVVGVTDDLTSRVNAVELVRVGAEAMGGKGGGGRPDMAQAGGPNAGAANDAVTAIEQALAS